MKTHFNSHDGEDSTWKIVYMDMITMLMILFLSLWVIDKEKVSDKGKRGDITVTKVEFEADDYFDPGKSDLKDQSLKKLNELFFGRKSAFPTPGFDADAGGRRVVLIHGHTDDQGEKLENFELGFERAMSVYGELQKKIPNLGDHVGICSFADNFPIEKVLVGSKRLASGISDRQRQETVRKRRKNRRFEIVGQFEEVFDPGDMLDPIDSTASKQSGSRR